MADSTDKKPKRDPRREFLTDSKMKALKPALGYGRDVVWDTGMPGMAVRISAKGKKTFYAVRRRMPTDRTPVWHQLGVYPRMTLAEARDAAREALNTLERGEHPKAIAEAQRQARAEAAANTFAAVAEEFIVKYLPTIKSGKKYESCFRRELIPAFGAKTITDLRRRDVITLLEGVAARSGKAAAMGALVVVRQMLNWALARDVIDFNPASAVKPKAVIGKVEARDRLLSDEELPVVWRAIDAVGEPFGTLHRVLLLVGARREEIAGAQWKEFDEDKATLLIPSERSKNGEAMLIPLPPLAVKLIAALPRFSGPFIFTTTAGQRPLGAHSAAKARLDAAIVAQGAELEPFVIHDFRRVVRSNLGRLGVPTVVAELCLGHKQPGILGVYDVHSYFDEKKSALRQWEARLLAVVSPEPTPEPAGDNVVPMRARA
jgi:integrase